MKFYVNRCVYVLIINISLREKCPISLQYLSVCGKIKPNAGKYGPEITPYLETFHVVFIFPIKLTAWVSEFGVYYDPYFPIFGHNTDICRKKCPYSVQLRQNAERKKALSSNSKPGLKNVPENSCLEKDPKMSKKTPIFKFVF